ncbi:MULTISPECIES: GNAT family N-acetyltransferase [Pseudoalteromonas]|uniref:GNAT family N-acetyltransferase n=1 Tax=Pseudoalteromonas rubra TaxID=43658 RepID=A0A5S3WX38_9GAMM|nr:MULTISPECIES: GNAT family N-acetyltransferase [Pseudoalteromonas]MCO7190434.1 GNAT family N-acetyltransferase [Pseudoalteromonas sp. XMcav2-N]TMP33627.1 GNAT family N-acetyltransferase [Pseudoalteromonas rubra]
MEIINLDPHHPEVSQLLRDIDALMNTLYPPSSNQLIPADELAAPDVYFVGARTEQALMGCGALVPKTDEAGELACYGELKRVYVQPPYRGLGVSKQIMQSLIGYARQCGFKILRLETGIRQTEAIGLYTSLGFIQCEAFGSYEPDPLSVYMELHLS